MMDMVTAAKEAGESTQGIVDKYMELKEAQDLVMGNAANAWKTAGLNVNEYMETVSGFAASLKQSTSSNIEAAKAADVAVQDMADNSAKMGTSMESIMAAYAGFSKGQYQLLDNLKIGYGGTKTEMEACVLMLQKAEHIQEPEEDMVTLREYIYGQVFYKIRPEKQIICCPIQVEPDSEFVKKSIKNCGFRAKYKGYIIGVERGRLPIVNPDKNMIIESGDLLWVIGTQKMANSLLRADLLDEEEE